jgi:tetratricopeptide (TPR) repeat protein
MNGELPEAETYYERIYALDSTSTSVLFSLGGINMRRGNEQKAEVFYRQILSHDSTNFSVYKQLAQIAIDKKDIVASLNNLLKANKINPADADVASDLSDLLINFKAYGPAEKVLDTAIDADPENVVLLESLAKLEYSRQKWPLAAYYSEKLLSLCDVSPVILTRLGIAYYNLAEYQCAIESFGQIDNLNQTETTYYYTGSCFKKLKDYPNALLWFQKTIDAGISANTNVYYTEMADTYETIKSYHKAEFDYKKAIEFKDDAITYYSIANLYDTELKDHKMALLYYKKFLAAKPSQTDKNYIAYAKNRIAVLGK